MKKLKIYFRATFLDWPYWRVTYKNGEQTQRLFYREAKGLSEVFNGKLWIDYTIKY